MLRIAIFRGAFFGVDYQEALEFELDAKAGGSTTGERLKMTEDLSL